MLVETGATLLRHGPVLFDTEVFLGNTECCAHPTRAAPRHSRFSRRPGWLGPSEEDDRDAFAGTGGGRGRVFFGRRMNGSCDPAHVIGRLF